MKPLDRSKLRQPQTPTTGVGAIFGAAPDLPDPRPRFITGEERYVVTLTPEPLVVLIPMRVPSPNAHPHWGVKQRQRSAVRGSLNLVPGYKRPRFITGEERYVVTLTRIATPRLDDDRNVGSMFVVRDEVARWLHGMPLEVQTKAGKRPPRAPDGPKSGIEFRYDARTARGYPPKYQAVEVRIEAKGGE